jgi:hypothetical protein
MIKSAIAAFMAVFLSVVSFLVPPVFADAYDYTDGIAGAITGFGQMPMICGKTSINPVFVTNFTDVPQTGSFTINPNLALEAEFFPTRDWAEHSKYATCMDNTPYGSAKMGDIAQTGNFTVQPGETMVAYLGMGGQDYNLDSTSHNIAIGGLPNGTANASWYDFWLDLGSDMNFKSLTLNYGRTGGPGNNGQNGFNVVQVSAGENADGTLNYTVTQNIVSPYSSKNTNGSMFGHGEPVVYHTNQAIGLAWIP